MPCACRRVVPKHGTPQLIISRGEGCNILSSEKALARLRNPEGRSYGTTSVSPFKLIVCRLA
jgi:hypothetical protein